MALGFWGGVRQYDVERTAAEKERKELSGIRKLAKDRAKKSSLHNKKLRDCRIHLGDIKKQNYWCHLS